MRWKIMVFVGTLLITSSAFAEKFCPTGGERYEDNVKFCPKHGTPLQSVTPSASYPSVPPQHVSEPSQQQAAQTTVNWLQLFGGLYDANQAYKRNKQIEAYNNAVIKQNETAVREQEQRVRMLNTVNNALERK